MKKLIAFLLLTFCVSIGYSQITKTQVVDLKGVTTTQRDALDVSSTWPIIYNTTTGQFERYNGVSWETFDGGAGGSVSSVNGLTGAVVLDLAINSNVLSTSGSGATVDLSGYLDNTDTQDLSLAANTLSLTDGGSVDLSGYLDNTDDQTATEVPFSPVGNIVSTNVQAAIAELESEKLASDGGIAGGTIDFQSSTFMRDQDITMPTDWETRVDEDKMLFRSETSSGSGAFTTRYSLDPSGVPTQSSDLTDKEYVDAAVAAGTGDGDKGDITVSGSGTTWTGD